jgi:CspA family cold shock protein
MNGKVKWFDPLKGYGFLISAEGDQQFFVHATELASSEFDTLIPEQLVTFDVRPDPRGRNSQAVNLRAPDTKQAPRASAPRKAANAAGPQP